MNPNDVLHIIALLGIVFVIAILAVISAIGDKD